MVELTGADRRRFASGGVAADQGETTSIIVLLYSDRQDAVIREGATVHNAIDNIVGLLPFIEPHLIFESDAAAPAAPPTVVSAPLNVKDPIGRYSTSRSKNAQKLIVSLLIRPKSTNGVSGVNLWYAGERGETVDCAKRKVTV